MPGIQRQAPVASHEVTTGLGRVGRGGQGSAVAVGRPPVTAAGFSVVGADGLGVQGGEALVELGLGVVDGGGSGRRTGAGGMCPVGLVRTLESWSGWRDGMGCANPSGFV